jgi:hypothetical protein
MWTGTFRDPRGINPEGGRPENALTGTIWTVNAWRNDPLLVPHVSGGEKQAKYAFAGEISQGGFPGVS